jgi:hypothetical protein
MLIVFTCSITYTMVTLFMIYLLNVLGLSYWQTGLLEQIHGKKKFEFIKGR